ARQVAEHSTAKQPGHAPVILFAATTRLGGFTLNAAFTLLTSWSLRLAGLSIRHFVCQAGMTHCVLGTNVNDLTQPPPCEACIVQSKRLYEGADFTWFQYSENADLAAAIRDLTVEELSHFEFPAHSIPVSPAPLLPLGQIVLPSVRWALRRHHLLDNSPTRGLLREYILSAYSLASKFSDFVKATQPSSAIIFNGILYPEATARWVTRQLGVRSVAFEVGFQPYSVFFTDGEPTAYPIHIPDDFELSDEQNALLDAQLEKRFQGKFTMAGIRFWPEMRGLDQSFLERAARFRQVIPIFTNVVYDSSQVHANTLFSNMFDWLELLLIVIRRHPETLFVIRAHPDEKRPVSNKISNESVHDWIYRQGVNELPNVVFIEPDEFISSYELIQRSKFVLVYNSSIGLEASLMGAAVVCGGKARYTQYPTVFLPDSPSDLERLVEKFLQAEQIEIPAEFQRNARRFLYYQFYRVSLPMDDFLQEGEKQGAVYLKSFSWQQLLPENSTAMRVIRDGILHDSPFILPEDQPL
ncbi:MAG: capsule polysaccharide biosynthesis family protein, partial [Chloroflexi bacterium]|nr:capsule polysaccharide biosynthesis family protein [Chloroflexota bacterium]